MKIEYMEPLRNDSFLRVYKFNDKRDLEQVLEIYGIIRNFNFTQLQLMLFTKILALILKDLGFSEVITEIKISKKRREVN